MIRTWALSLLLIGFGKMIQSQSLFPTPSYPSNYLFPLKIPIQLVGNFGECRPDHFHSGLDIRTNGRENIPVYAVENGYVSKVIVMPSGFGNALCITHPGGYSTLYAHLNNFFPELQAYVKRRQYQTQSWKQEMVLMPHQFPVRRGQQIAKSGNTGSSHGPHLHMEIRKTKGDIPLNPLFFYPQLTDTKPPVFKKLAIYNASQSIYTQDPLLIKNLLGSTSNFRLTDTVRVPFESVYCGVEAIDLMQVATGTLGFYEMQVGCDGQARLAWRMDAISYSDTRYMNALVDYKTSFLHKIWIQLGHILPGNRLTVYKKMHPKGGEISLSDGQPHRVQIKILDTHGNQSELLFWIRKTSTFSKRASCQEYLGSRDEATVLRNGLRVFIASGTLYDFVCQSLIQQRLNEKGMPFYDVFDQTIPLHVPLKVSIRPGIPVGPEQKSKMCLRPLSGKGTLGRGCAMQDEDGWWITSLQQSGRYCWQIDTSAPVIQLTHRAIHTLVSGDRLEFEIKEESTQVEQVLAMVDRQWLCLEQRGNRFYYQVDEHFPKGQHTLLIKAWDANRNERTFVIQLNRK